MDRVAKKYKRRGEDMKSSDASSDEMTADANILLHVLVKFRGKEKHPDGCSNFNHLANEDIICSFEDNLKFSSKNVVEFNGMQEVLPVCSPSDPVTNLPHCFISPNHHSSKNLLLHTMNPLEDGFVFVHLRSIIYLKGIQLNYSKHLSWIVCNQYSFIEVSANFKVSEQVFLQENKG